MSARMRKHHTDLYMVVDNDSYSFSNVPNEMIRSFIQSLIAYEEDSVPWREVYKDAFKKVGGEIPYTIRAYRSGENMTQKKLAKLLKMPQGNISQIENGKRPVGKKLAKKLGKIFNVSYRMFL